MMSKVNGKTVRGTSNGNSAGSSEDRRRRKAWLLEAFAADVKLIGVTYDDGVSIVLKPEPTANYRWWLAQLDTLPLDPTTVDIVGVVEVPTCRCYRCGDLLHAETVTVDRVIPGCKGGTYRRDNIRPACGMCNSVTGGGLRS